MIKKKKNMATDTILSVRMKSSVKNKAKKVLAGYGFDLSTTVNLYLRNIADGVVEPTFGHRIVPKKVMEKWEKEIQQMKKRGDKGFNSVKELMEDLMN